MNEYTYDPKRGFTLDTNAKVEWANAHAPKLGREYRLGDDCYYRPTKPIPEPAPSNYEGWYCG